MVRFYLMPGLKASLNLANEPSQGADEDMEGQDGQRDGDDDGLDGSHDVVSQMICFLLPRPGPRLSVRLTWPFFSSGLSRGVMVLLSM
tara:strand:- start:189 stop:452 length:264 start_codon:yes stop_codon:yes gene_type:complete